MNRKQFVFGMKWILLIGLLFLVVSCRSTTDTETPEADLQATVDAAVSLTVAARDAENALEEAAEVAQATDVPTLPPVPTQLIETPTEAATVPPPATSTPPPTSTPVQTATAEPTETAVPTEEPTEAPTSAAPAPTQPPPPPAEPVFGGNVLINGSFEGGWYNLNGAPEFQLPNGWTLEYDSGPTGFGGQAWDVWFPPEVRVLPYFQLPESERGLFIREGEYTIKAFKGNGPISFRFLQDIALQPGTYLFTVYIFPDLVSSYDGGKQYSGDPSSGEVRFIAPGGGTNWLRFAAFGTWGTFQHTFTVDSAQTVRIGVAMRGKYALASNGFFIDDWSLQRVEN